MQTSKVLVPRLAEFESEENPRNDLGTLLLIPKKQATVRRGRGGENRTYLAAFPKWISKVGSLHIKCKAGLRAQHQWFLILCQKCCTEEDSV